MSPYLAQIRLYPVKALDPAVVAEARVAPGGALELDRRWALFDEHGKFVNAKNEPAVHRLRARHELGPDGPHLTLTAGEETARFSLDGDRASIEAFCARAIGRRVELRRDDATGFPDDPEAPGPTVVSTASLEAVSAWFPGLDTESTRRRFRANLEVGGVEPFWEDRLFAQKGELVRFRIGDVLVEGSNPCQRCAVPPRDPETGEPIPGFQKIFSERREATLPPWAEPSRFNHFYRFTVNTRVPPSEAGKVLRVGDPVRL